jgi:hypothetical protein
VAESRDRKDAILASRSVGLGRSISLALPLEAPANPEWRNWPQLSETIRHFADLAAAPSGDPRIFAQLARKGDILAIHVRAADEKGPVDLLQLKASALGDGFNQEPVQVSLMQVAPGEYKADTNVGRGPLAVVVRDAGGRTVWQGTSAALYPEEFAGVGPNWDNLSHLAQATGGRIVSGAKLAGLAHAREGAGETPLWPYLAAAALVMMLLDSVTARVLRRA